MPNTMLSDLTPPPSAPPHHFYEAKLFFPILKGYKADKLKGFATFWKFSFHGQKKVADNEYQSLFAEKKIIFILNFSFLMCSNLGLFPQTTALRKKT